VADRLNSRYRADTEVNESNTSFVSKSGQCIAPFVIELNDRILSVRHKCSQFAIVARKSVDLEGLIIAQSTGSLYHVQPQQSLYQRVLLYIDLWHIYIYIYIYIYIAYAGRFRIGSRHDLIA